MENEFHVNVSEISGPVTGVRVENELPFHGLETSGHVAGFVNVLFKEMAARGQVRRHARPVGVWRAPSFQQVKFSVLRVSTGNLFSGSLIVQAGFVDTNVNAGLCDSGSGMVLDGIFIDTIDFEDSEVATVPGMEVDCIFVMTPSGLVLDGIPTDTTDYEHSEAAIAPLGCSSSAAAVVPSGCSSCTVPCAEWGEATEGKLVQFFVNRGKGSQLWFAVLPMLLCRMFYTLTLMSVLCVDRGWSRWVAPLVRIVLGVVRMWSGGASLYLDVPGQWECKVCHATRCWLARKRCHKCDAPRDMVPDNPPMGPLGRAPPQSRSSGPRTRSSGLWHVPPRNRENENEPLPGAGVGSGSSGAEVGKKREAGELLQALSLLQSIMTRKILVSTRSW